MHTAKKILGTTFVALATLTFFSSDALADEKTKKTEAPAEEDATTPSEEGFSLGLRLGYALPMGSVAKDARLRGFTDSSKYASGIVPIWVDAGYRINPNWYVGGYFQFAFMSTSGDFCKALVGNNPCSSSGNNIRFGVTARYSFRPQAKINPWVGVSSGYEIQSISATSGGQTGDVTMKGFEFVGLHVGGDVRVARDVTVGPMINASFGQYSGDSWSLPGNSGSADYTNSALHSWVFLGIRGTYDL